MGRTFIIGGAQVYDLAFEMNFVESVYLTTIHDYVEGDRFFHLDKEWKPVQTLEETEIYDIKVYRK
jgi:dihydrofolate reductase